MDTKVIISFSQWRVLKGRKANFKEDQLNFKEYDAAAAATSGCSISGLRKTLSLLIRSLSSSPPSIDVQIILLGEASIQAEAAAAESNQCEIKFCDALSERIPP